MQELTGDGEVAVPRDRNLTTALWEAAGRVPDRPAVARRVGAGFEDWTLERFATHVRELAKGLVASGIGAGDRVCVFSATRLEWTLFDYALWSIGAVTVPIYETSSAEQVAWIVEDSGAVAIVCERPELRQVYEDAVADGGGCEHVFVIEEGAVAELRGRGVEVSDEDIEARAGAVSGDDVATIVYTSGTTGRPKGCVITHHNFVWDAEQVVSVAREFFTDGESTLLFLPLAHIFARVIQVACVSQGVKLGYSSGVPQLLEELKIYRPSFLLSVPRVFEKVFNGAQQRAHSEGKGAIFDRAAAAAIAFSRERQDGRVGLRTRALHALFDKLVYRKLRDALGGRVRYAVSGGAALGERLGHFFDGVGVTILEGYGLTETTAGATINRPDAYRIGTVGRPIPGCTVRIAEDGEVLVRGDNVFRGYHGNEEATAEAIDDQGWFHTGDLGSLDEDGFLRITGRKKEIIVTAAGKNVAPAVLEDRMRAHPLVSQAMVVGDDRPFVAALVAIDADEFPRWAAENGLEGVKLADVADDPALRAAIQDAVDAANDAVSRAESVREFRIVPEDFTIEGGELTPTLKVRREVVADKYGGLIEDIYA